jgi:hypothetical protein
MRFEDVNIGDWFKIGMDIACYMKIAHIEDKWGSLWVAINDHGYPQYSEDLTADYEVIPLDKEVIPGVGFCVTG